MFTALTRRRLRKVSARPGHRHDPAHVHTYDRERVEPEYLGVGAVLKVCACGAPAPMPTRIDS